MKIEIHGRQVEVDDSFKDMSEEQQHQVVDEIAAGLMPTASEAAAAQETKEAQGPDVLPNIGAGAEATALRYGVGVPAVWGVDKLKKLLGGADKALPAQPAPSPIPGEERWFNSANAINEKAKIIRRNTELAQRYPQFERVVPPAPPIPLKEKVATGLQGLRTSPGGKAFTSGYNLMDVVEHAGEGPLGNAQATASGLAALAPYAEKYLPGKAKKIAKALPFVTPAANYVIDKFTGQPVPVTEQKAAGGAIQHFQKGKLVEEAAKAALKKLNLADFEGKTLLGTLADRTKVGDGLKGGPMFPTIYPGAAWAMNAPGAASRLVNAMQAAGGPESTIVAPMLMKNTAHKSNRDVADMAVNQFKQNYEAGLFTPERLAEIENNIRKVPGLEKHPGLLHPEAEDLLHNMTFNQRGKLVNWLGSKAKTNPAMDLQKLLRETAEPGLFDEPLGAVGPSVFKLSGEQSYKPGLHNSYDYIVHGEPVGAINPIPREFLFRDLETKARKELGRSLSDYNYRTSVGVPSQLIDDKLLKSLDELGYLKPEGFAPGGKVMKAAVEEFKKKFTPGFYHGSPSPNIEAFDPTKSVKDPMYITPKATFVTRDPEFAESFLSMNNSGKIKSGSTMYPVNVNLGQHWNPNTPEGQAVIQDFIEKYPKRVNLEKGLKRGDWTAIENSDFLSHLKNTGHDTFHVVEGGVPNVGVLKPQNIRGKFAKYNPEDAESPDFMKAQGGLAKIKKK